MIADLWTSYEHNVDHSTISAVKIGSYSGGGGTPNYSNHEKVNLKVKGDNRIYNILYAQKVDKDGYLKVTSIGGDGSERGTLTLGPSSSSVAMKDATTVFGSADDNYSEPCFGLEIDGATVFASDTPHKVTGPHCVLGGGTNNKGYVTIKGGRVTAISHSTGAAIGGGGGMDSWGGDGYVNISGGKVCMRIISERWLTETERCLVQLLAEAARLNSKAIQVMSQLPAVKCMHKA